MNGHTETKLDTIVKDINEIKVSIAKLQVLVNGGAGNAPECQRHRSDIERIDRKIARWGGAFMLVVPICSVLSPIIIKLIWK